MAGLDRTMGPMTARYEPLECCCLFLCFLKPLDDAAHSIAEEAMGRQQGIKEERLVLLLDTREV